MPEQERGTRRSGEGHKEPDHRTYGKLDRDRILYSTEFRRLAGVTQVVSAGQEEIFHNRLTHTLKVAQIARRLAETFADKQKKEAKSWGGVNPDVVEAAAMAHDLGHPPFGHLAEEELTQAIREVVVRETYRSQKGTTLPENPKDWPKEATDQFARTEGFEGNAQSFRIITRLAVRREHDSPYGLDLSRASLNATLKYPSSFSPPEKKYGMYETDREAFDFARDGAVPGGSMPCIEGQIMDWADDIAYSVHDVEDFYRAGLIPLDRLVRPTKDLERFRDRVVARWDKIGKNRPLPDGMAIHDFVPTILTDVFEVEGPYTGTRESRAETYSISTRLIHRLVSDTKLLHRRTGNPDGLEIAVPNRAIVAVLKELIWHYIIEAPALAAQQHGQRAAISQVFHILFQAHANGQHYLFPAAFQQAAKDLAASGPVEDRARLVADSVASLSDQQAIRLYQRLTATAQGSVLDPIMR